MWRYTLTLIAGWLASSALIFGATVAVVDARELDGHASLGANACPVGVDALQVVAGSQWDCNPSGRQRVDVHYVGSDGIEVRKFRRRCNRVGGDLVWRAHRPSQGQGLFVCEGIDH